MKKMNKKGFTLIELLAVIIILGVLLLIAVPAVQNVIQSSQQKAFVNSTLSVIDGIKSQAALVELEGSVMPAGSTTCYWNFADVKLERGSIDGQGYATVSKDAATGALSYSITAQSDRGYVFNGVSSDNISVSNFHTGAFTYANQTTTCNISY